MRPTSHSLAAFLPSFLWMGVIFVFSQHGNIETNLRYEFLFKKGAHVAEFGVLALLFLRAQNSSWGARVKRHAEKAWSWSVLYAVFDELHQAFVPTRTAHPRDVVLDSLGALLALAVFYFLTSSKKTGGSIPGTGPVSFRRPEVSPAKTSSAVTPKILKPKKSRRKASRLPAPPRRKKKVSRLKKSKKR